MEINLWLLYERNDDAAVMYRMSVVRASRGAAWWVVVCVAREEERCDARVWWSVRVSSTRRGVGESGRRYRADRGRALVRPHLCLVLALLLVVMMVMVMMPPRALAPSPLLVVGAVRLLISVIAAAAAEAPPLLLIPCAQRLAAELQVFVLDDDGLHPRVGVYVDLARRGVEGLQVGHEVVRRLRLGRHFCGVATAVRCVGLCLG